VVKATPVPWEATRCCPVLLYRLNERYFGVSIVIFVWLSVIVMVTKFVCGSSLRILRPTLPYISEDFNTHIQNLFVLVYYGLNYFNENLKLLFSVKGTNCILVIIYRPTALCLP
jgi:hypothetical protein